MHDEKFYFYYFWGSGIYLYLTSSSWKTILALILCPHWSPQRCPPIPAYSEVPSSLAALWPLHCIWGTGILGKFGHPRVCF